MIKGLDEEKKEISDTSSSEEISDDSEKVDEIINSQKFSRKEFLQIIKSKKVANKPRNERRI